MRKFSFYTMKSMIIWFLVGITLMLGLTSCGSTQKVGEIPTQPETCLVGKADGSVNQLTKTLTGFTHPTFGNLTVTKDPSIYVDGKGGRYRFFPETKIFVPILTPVYQWKESGQVSPPISTKKKPSTPATKSGGRKVVAEKGQVKSDGASEGDKKTEVATTNQEAPPKEGGVGGDNNPPEINLNESLKPQLRIGLVPPTSG